MTAFTTAYKPSVHGFRFGNRFRHHLIFGLSTWGRCNGIAQVSLDYFRAGRPAPRVDVVNYDTGPISGLGAASWAPDRVDLFVRRYGDWIATKRFEAGRFSDWRDVSASEVSLSPDAAAWGPGRIDLVVRGHDAKVLHHAYDNGWTGAGGPCMWPPGFPDDRGGQFTSAPAVAAPFANRLELYGRGLNGELWFSYWDGAWHDWTSLGRPPGIELTSDPAAAAQMGWMTALVRGSDRAIWQREWSNNRWQPWRSLGGVATSPPAVASPFPGRAEAYVRGLDGGISLSILENGRWGPWASLGAPPPGLSEDRPAAVSHRGFLDVYARANDESVWHRRWSNGWRPWETTELQVTDEARRLTDVIYGRLMTSTITPLLAAIPLGPVALAFVGSMRNYVTLRPHNNEQLFAWAAEDEMEKLTRFFQAGNPVPLGLLDTGGGFGHEVVAFGGDINVRGRSVINVYDPNFPGCDTQTITLDPASRSIASTSGNMWRALWLRDDYRPEPPPV